MMWKAFLPVGKPKIRVSRVDIAFFAARGIDRKRLAGALAVLHLVRRHIARASFQASFSKAFAGATWVSQYSFLVHEHQGAPHIELTLWLSGKLITFKEVRRLLPKPWRNITPCTKKEPDEPVAGLSGIPRSLAQETVCRLSEWYVATIWDYDIQEGLKRISDIEVLKHVGQYLHLLANMSQLVVA